MKAGDIIIVHSGKSFIPKAIQGALRKYKLWHDKPVKEKVHHTGNIIDVWGQPYVSEAVKNGYRALPLLQAYSKDVWDTRIIVKTPKKPYTNNEQRDISRNAITYCLRITRYDFSNFFYQLVYIFTGKWYGKKGTKATVRLYCSEATATLANGIRPDTFKNPYAVNPVDVAINDKYIIQNDLTYYPPKPHTL